MLASIREVGVRRRRAPTLLNTTTMQNVAWPIMIVNKLKVMPRVLMPVRSAIPVTIPASAIGSTRTNEIAWRPKNR